MRRDKNFAYVRLVSSVASARLPSAAHKAQLGVPCPIGIVLANPADAETNGTVLIQGSLGCFCLKLPATLSPPDDRIPGPCLGAHRPAAKAHTRGGQYQFERACPLAAFSEIAQDPIRRIWEEVGWSRGCQAFKNGPRSQFELLRVVPAKISAPF
jgi:hypothetical protein